jgi:peptidyl-prolyl cis-trans isomerase D
MLNAMRNFSQSGIIKAFLMVLIASFAMWGIGDVFRGGSASAILSVGDEELTQSEFVQSYSREVNRLRAMFGGEIPPEITGSVKAQVMQQFVEGSLIRQEAKRMGINVHDEQMKEAIIKDPNFQENGQFSKPLFKATLERANLSERDFFNLMSEELHQRQITQNLLAGSPTLTPQSTLLHQYDHQKRRARVLTIAQSAVDVPQTPEESTLLNFYEDHKDMFETEPYRGFTLLPLTREAVEDDIEISDDEIERYYQENKELFVDPTSGVIAEFDSVKEQIANELKQQRIDERLYALSTELQDMLAGGSTLKEAGEALGLPHESFPPINAQGVFNDGSNLANANYPETLVQLIFDMEEGQEPTLHETPNGYLAVALNDLIPSRIRALDEVRASATRAWREQAQREALEQLGEEIRLALEEGKSLRDVQKNFGLSAPKRMTLKRQSTQPDLPDALVSDLFTRQVGEHTIAYATDQGDLKIAQLEEIIDADTATAMASLPQLTRLQNGFQSDVMEYYQQYMQRHHPVEVHIDTSELAE